MSGDCIMSTYTQVHPVSGITYVYTRNVVIDPDTGKKKVVRKCIGKLNDKGETVATGPVGRPAHAIPPGQYLDARSVNRREESNTSSDSSVCKNELKRLTLEVERLRKKNEKQSKIIQQIVRILKENGEM